MGCVGKRRIQGETMTLEAQREEAIRLYRDQDLTVKQVAARLSIRQSTAGNWLRGLKRPRPRKTALVVSPAASVLAEQVDSTRAQFEEIVNRIGVETALDWMSAITRERGKSLRSAATAMEIANEQIAQVLERTRSVLANGKH
jgi:transposase-like protein